MFRSRIVAAVAVAVLVALGASYFVYRQMERASQGVKTVQMGQIVVAATTLPLGTRLEPEQLRVIPWPANEPVQGMFTRTQDCAGRALLTPVIANQPILEGNLAPMQAGAGLPAVIPEGMRAMSVAVNDVVGVAGFVLPGTSVDVLATGQLEGRSNQSITRTILENIRVLAAGQRIQQDKNGKPATVPVITLLLKPEQADALAMASTEGKIQLALRNTIDTKETEPPPVLSASLFGAPAVPRRAGPIRHAAPPPPSFVVEVIRGEKRQTKTF
jgi:pilus assembly protein CpaB